MTKRRLLLLYALALLLSALARGNALDDYVHRPDPAYGWSLEHTEEDAWAHYYVLHLVSQRWLNTGLVKRPLWTHTLRLAQPRRFCGHSATHSATAILVISGRDNPIVQLPADPPRPIPWEAGLIADTFCRPVAELHQVPNQPLVFDGEQRIRKEDALLAYSLDRYLRGTPGDWPAHLAMVKAVVRAMDALQAFSRSRDDIPDIKDFVLLGSSKRGWTAWLTAAVDPRVRALVPVSIDMPNLAEQFPHHFAAYGDYAPALKDYKAFDIGCRMNSARGHELLQLIDPFAYRDRLTMPKLVLNSTGDEFFVSDASQFYFDRMPGQNWLRYTPNSDHVQHGYSPLVLFQQISNWVNDLLAGKTPPSLRWQRDSADELTVTPSQRPYRVRLWEAENEHARDFRRETLGPVWRARTLAPDPEGHYRVLLQAPPRGWRAALVEVTFGGFYSGSQQVYTTPVFVLPDTLPYAPGSACHAGPATRMAASRDSGAATSPSRPSQAHPRAARGKPLH